MNKLRQSWPLICTALICLLVNTIVLLKYGAQAASEEISPGTVIADSSGTEMVYVPSAIFIVGIDQKALHDVCNQRGEVDPERCIEIIKIDTGATYTYTIHIPAFWIDLYEVTVNEFDQHCIANVNILLDPCADSIRTARPDLFENPQQPRIGVSWVEAMLFCTVRGARLPTEAEWEYAASGPDKLIFPWGNNFQSEYLHSPDVTYPPQKTYPVGTMPNNQSWIGIYDMAGNAAEWVEDRFLPRLLSELPLSEVIASNKGFDTNTRRVIRGGSWDGRPWPMATFFRESEQPQSYSEYVGFRCARHTHPRQE